MTALAIVKPSDLATQEYFTAEQKRLIKSLIAPEATDDELQVFMYQCKRTGLDPFSRQIYCIHRNERGRGKRMTIQTGIDGFRIIADRTQRYAPGRDTTFEEDEQGNLLRATAYVKKYQEGVWHEVPATAEWSEYVVADNYMWKTKRRVMLGKCAEALALRKAFPLQLSGLYTSDEMGKSDTDLGASTGPIVPMDLPEVGPVTPDMITGPDTPPPPAEPTKAPAREFLAPDPADAPHFLEAEYTEKVPVYDVTTGETIRFEPGITSEQNKLLHVLRRDLGHLLNSYPVVDGKRAELLDGKYRKALKERYGKENTNELSVREASEMIDALTRMRDKKYAGTGHTPPSVANGTDPRAQ